MSFSTNTAGGVEGTVSNEMVRTLTFGAIEGVIGLENRANSIVSAFEEDRFHVK
jgi:hypothetical protein